MSSPLPQAAASLRRLLLGAGRGVRFVASQQREEIFSLRSRRADWLQTALPLALFRFIFLISCAGLDSLLNRQGDV